MTPASATPRLVGLDIARGLAVLGMFIAHTAPRVDDTELLADGRSSILFATIAGVSIGLMTGGRDPLPPGRRSDRVVSIALRALVLYLLGVSLSVLDHNILIILDYYAVMFLLLIPLLFLPRWAMAVVGATLAFTMPALATSIGNGDPASAITYLAQYYLLLGSYPALVWLPFLIAGLICARSGLGRESTQAWMMAAGTFSAVLGYGAAQVLPGVSAEAHSGSTAELFGSGGLAIAVVGALCWLTSERLSRFGAVLRFVLWPVAATGSMALTIYSLQIVTLAVVADQPDTDAFLIGLSVASVLFASLWRYFLGRGPLERVMTLLTQPARGRIPSAAPPPAS